MKIIYALLGFLIAYLAVAIGDGFETWMFTDLTGASAQLQHAWPKIALILGVLIWMVAMSEVVQRKKDATLREFRWFAGVAFGLLALGIGASAEPFRSGLNPLNWAWWIPVCVVIAGIPFIFSIFVTRK